MSVVDQMACAMGDHQSLMRIDTKNAPGGKLLSIVFTFECCKATYSPIEDREMDRLHRLFWEDVATLNSELAEHARVETVP